MRSIKVCLLCVAAALASVCASASAGTVVATWGADALASHPKTLKIIPVDGSSAVIQADLKALGQGAKVRAARLYLKRRHVTVPPAPRGQKAPPIADDALAACEVYSLPSYAAGAKPAPAGEPMGLVGPRFDCVDVAAAVARGAGGTCHLYVVLPGWQRDDVRLEIAYEGAPPKMPEQASAVRAVHRAGQTFITFKEIEDVAGGDALTWERFKALRSAGDAKRRVRYHVYRSAGPITAETLAEAQRIAVVEPLSGWNANGRNSERAIDLKLASQYAHIHGHWNPFADARVEGSWGVHCPIDRFVIADGQKPLRRDTGLVVHTAAEKARAYYAVIVSINGAANTGAIGPGNATAEGVAESPADPQPVCQGELPKLPFWNYPEKRLHYVRWVGPDCANLPGAYYNWSVAVPARPAQAGGPDGVGENPPMELHLHRDDWSYWRTDYRVERDSIVVTPYDFPLPTWWYGYHEAAGTLKSFRQGVVRNYTERRVMWFVDWAAKRWGVDRSRIGISAVRRSTGGGGATSGNRGAATNGAIRLALRHPEVFNTALIGYDVRPDYAAGEPNPNCLEIWGKVAWACKTCPAGGPPEAEKNVWEDTNLLRHVRAMPASADVPLITMSAGRTDDKALIEMTNTLLDKGFPILFQFNYWPGPKMIPVSATGTWPAPMIRLDVRRGRPLPAFRTMTIHGKRGYFKQFSLDEKACGDVNVHLRWSDAAEQADRVEMTIWAADRWARTDVPTDVTLRRLTRFKAAAGQTVAWSFKVPAGKDRRDTPTDQSGEVAVGADGLIVVPALMVKGTPGKLVVTRK